MSIKVFTVTALLVLQNFSLFSQTITGKLVNQNSTGLSGLILRLYSESKVYKSTSAVDGYFAFNDISSVKPDQLPAGYSVSENYPNPFNPRTRICFTLPSKAIVKVSIFNQLGQLIKEESERNYSAGANYIDVELNGLANGFYIARITIDGKLNITRKLMLLYGSQHLSTSNSYSGAIVGKCNPINVIKLDSLVVIGSGVGRKTFTNLPEITGTTLDLGNFTINVGIVNPCPGISSIIYEGKTYNTNRQSMLVKRKY